MGDGLSEASATLVQNGNEVGVQVVIPTGIKDPERLNVLLYEVLSACSKAEYEVSVQTPDWIDQKLKIIRAVQYVRSEAEHCKSGS